MWFKAKVYTEEEVAENPNELKKYDNMDVYEYELPAEGEFEDDNIDSDEVTYVLLCLFQSERDKRIE